MADSELFVKLRDCFTAGYTLPQYCIDNGIKRPLFVSEKKHRLFVWEVYVQFHYDKRLIAQFCFLDAGGLKPMDFHAVPGLARPLKIQSLADMNLDDFDKIVLLTPATVEISQEKVVPFAELLRFFIRRTYADIPLLHFLRRYPKVKLFMTAPPPMSRYKGASKFAKTLCNHAPAFRKRLLEDRSGNVKTTLDRFGYTNAQALELASSPLVKTNLDGTTVMLDDDTTPLQGVKNGRRMTACQPAHYRNKIYFFGQCIFYGVFAPFDKTLESYLQQMLNEADLPYCVENCSQFLNGRTQDILYNLNALQPAPGDIIFVVLETLRPNSDIIPFVDISNIFDPPLDYRDFYCVKNHVNELGYKLMAEKYFKFLTENNFFREADMNYPAPPPVYHRYGIPPQYESGDANSSVSEELEAYKQALRAKRLPVGSLVMNCNPFTLGHQYLVEYAAAQVAKLYLFVVEEDKSEFPFADRIELVKAGVAHLPNVEVLPSGKFIISQTTFSGYFNKAELQNVAVDSSEDVEIFGREIAPTLGITIRFAGTEPTDNVTRQYNETMKTILPRYGVEFREISRKEFDGEPISASKVRAALKQGDFDKIAKLVPPTTLAYLRGRH